MIISLIGVIYSDTRTGVASYLESLSVCAGITAVTGEYQIIEAELNYGKWVRKQFGSEIVKSPQGDVISQNQSILICSAGREASFTGSQGFLKIQEKTTKTIWKITWDRPFIGDDKYKWDEYDQSKLEIRHREINSFYYHFDVQVKGDNRFD